MKKCGLQKQEITRNTLMNLEFEEIGGDYPMVRTVSPIILFYLQKSVF